MARESSTDQDQMETCFSHLASGDRSAKIVFSEIVWKNGQISIQGLSLCQNNPSSTNTTRSDHHHFHLLSYPLSNSSSGLFSKFNQNTRLLPDSRCANLDQEKELISSSNPKEAHSHNSNQPSATVQHQQPPPKQPSTINFSYFKRLVGTTVKANPQVVHSASADKVSVMNGNKRYPSLEDSTNPKKEGKKPLLIKPRLDDANCLVGAFVKTKIEDEDNIANTSRFAAHGGKYIKLEVPPTSLCSGNDPKPPPKRKYTNIEKSDNPIEDVKKEEESTGVRKRAAAGGRISAKRSRAAQVPNLSEKRLRKRINQRMHTLQQLIPGGNSKVDKASVLDDAIGYLKTLQTQAKMMYMGRCLLMPPHPMMWSTGIQPMNVPHLAPLSPPMMVGMGMGTGMSFGMGTHDITGNSSACPLIQVPPTHVVPFPYLSILGMARMFGPPNQGIPIPMPPQPEVTLSQGPSTKSGLVPAMTGAPVPVPTECINAELPSRNSESLKNYTMAQGRIGKDGIEQSALNAVAPRQDHGQQSSGNAVIGSS